MFFTCLMNVSQSMTPQLYEQKLNFLNYSEVPPIISYINSTPAYIAAKEIFPGDVVYLSLEERRKYNSNINKLYKPTGLKLF